MMIICVLHDNMRSLGYFVSMHLTFVQKPEEVGSDYTRHLKNYFVNCIFYLKFHVSLDGHNIKLVNSGGEKG